MITMSAETLWKETRQKTQVSLETKRTSQTKVSTAQRHMTHVDMHVIVFVLLLVALMVVTFHDDGQSRVNTQVHGVTVGFTGLGVVCAAYLSAAPNLGNRTGTNIMERCLIMCVASAAAQSSCSGAPFGHMLLTTVATWLIVIGKNASTINVRHACTMTTTETYHASSGTHSSH